MERLVGGRIRAFDDPAVARLKGDGRWAAVLARALTGQVRRAGRGSRHLDGLGTDHAAGGRSRRQRSPRSSTAMLPFATGRRALRTQLERMARRQFTARRGEDAAEPGRLRHRPSHQRRLPGRARAHLADDQRPGAGASGSCRVARRCSRAAEGVLDADEQRRVIRPAAAQLDDEPWTAAELVLVDEAEALVNGVARVYGHIVVDEAQDLSAMELRARRPPLPEPLDDRARRSRPGHRSGRPVLVGRRTRSTSVRRPARRSRSSSSATGSRPRSSMSRTCSCRRSPPRCGRPGRCASRAVPRCSSTAEPERLGAAVAGVVADAASRWASVGVDRTRSAPRHRAQGARRDRTRCRRRPAAGPGHVVSLLSPAQAKGLRVRRRRGRVPRRLHG